MSDTSGTNLTFGFLTDSTQRFKTLLRAILDDPRRELEWVELLSQLEFVGCRKSVPLESEEASNAVLLKSLIEKGGARRRSWGQAPLAQLGWDYFRDLDEGISQLQEDARAHYPAVNWVIQRRVQELYPIYLAMTRNASVKRVLTLILAQERFPGQGLSDGVFSDWFRKRAIAIEAQLWEQFCTGIEEWLTAPSAPAVAPVTRTPVPLVH
jgi:hypothetical protein